MNDENDVYELPLLYNERNIYSLIAVAINSITPIHLSEWSFNSADEPKLNNSRIVDFWCLNKVGEKGNPINYFIELKKGYYFLGKRNSKKDFTKSINGSIKEIISQIKDLKKLEPEWKGYDNA